MSVHAAIVTSEIRPDAVLARLDDTADGAKLLFLGTVRETNGGRPVSGMRYDAYAEMAEKVLAEIAADVARVAGTDRVAIEHRTGELGLGEISVAIAVATPHRAHAFDACRHAIEEIKSRLPVWKKEHYTDGGDAWLDGTTPDVREAAR